MHTCGSPRARMGRAPFIHRTRAWVCDASLLLMLLLLLLHLRPTASHLRPPRISQLAQYVLQTQTRRSLNLAVLEGSDDIEFINHSRPNNRGKGCSSCGAWWPVCCHVALASSVAPVPNADHGYSIVFHDLHVRRTRAAFLGAK